MSRVGIGRVHGAHRGAEWDNDGFSFERPEWQARAECRVDVIPNVWQEFGKHPTDLFFPNGTPTTERLQAIDVVCGACPVRAQCDEHALAHESPRVGGYWAGRSPEQRRLEQRRRGIVVDVPEFDSAINGTLGTVIVPTHGTNERYSKHMKDGEPACGACLDAHMIHQSYIASDRWHHIKMTETPAERKKRLDDRRRRSAGSHRFGY